MWLVYLRFDDQGQVVTMHIRTGSGQGAQDIVSRAEQHGYTSTARLVDYASFYAHGTIKLPHPSAEFHDHREFIRRWELVK